MNSAELEQGKEQLRSEAIFWTRVCWTFFGVAACILGFEMLRLAYEWLRYGEAEHVLLSYWIAAPQFRWVGVQRAIDVVWGFPIWLVAVLFMVLTTFLAELNDWHAKSLGLLK